MSDEENSDQNEIPSEIRFAKILLQSDKKVVILPIDRIKLIESENKLKDFIPENRNDFIKLQFVYAVDSSCEEGCKKKKSHLHYRPVCVQLLGSK